jgi:large subunit ribosomal protein L25
MDRTALKAQTRKLTGKRVRFLRRSGLTPANLYGPSIESLPLEIETPVLQRLLAHGGRHTLVDIQLEDNGRSETAFLWEVQRHPITEAILHVDFYRADLTRKLRMAVPIELVGKALAVNKGASIIQTLNELEVEGPPLQIPSVIQVDISPLTEPNDHILVQDLKVPEVIEVLSPPDQVIVRAAPPRKEEVAVPVPAAEGVEVAAPEAAEGEAKEEEKAEE